MLLLFLAILLVYSPVYGSLIPPVSFGNTIRDLYATDSGDMIMMASQWTINGSVRNTTVVSRCIETYLGGVRTLAPQGSFKRSYTNLPVHNVVDLALNVKIIDVPDMYASLFKVKIDDIYFQTIYGSPTSSYNYDCAGSDPDWNINWSLRGLGHSSSTITVEIFWEMNRTHGIPTFAIRDLVLSFQNSNSPSSKNCPNGFYNDDGSCIACDSACQNCFGPSSTQCFPCQMGYNLVGNECVQCPSNCSLCSGPNKGQCLLCNRGYTLDFDGTCNPQGICNSSPYVIKDNNELMDYGYSLSVCAHSCSEGEAILPNGTCAACNFPLQKVTNGGTMVCRSPCSASKYLLPNGSCSGYCPGSTRHVSGFLLCDLPCNQYLYPNGSCLPTCAAPYAAGKYMNIMTCDNPCPYGQYLYPNGSCKNNCSYGYQVEYQSTVSGGIASKCSLRCESNQYLYQDGNCSATCRPDFIESIDSNNNKVCNFPCYKTGGILYENGTCSSNCPLDFVYYESWFSFCRFPCASNQYYSNGRCTGSCEVGSTSRIEGSYRFCDSNTTNIRTDAPCSSASFYKYQNGSCLRTCPFPLLSTWQAFKYYCTYPCSPGNYLYPNTSCLPDCQPGFIPRIDGNMSFCDYNPTSTPASQSNPCFIYSGDGVMTTNCSNANNTCPNGYFQYQNGSCLSSCKDPYYSILGNGSAYCSSPCTSNEFLYPDGTCSMACTQGLSISENNFGFCDTNEYEYNSTNGTCPQGLFKYDNGSCLSICLFPLSTIWEDGNAFCRSPCSPGAFLYPNGTCSWSCNMYMNWNIVIEGSIQYCKPPCSENQYQYHDTCLSTCDHPRKSFIYFGITHCYDEFLIDCYIYNATWYGDGFYQNTCSNPYNDCEGSNFEYEDGSCVSVCRYPMIPEIRNFSAFCVKDPNYTGPDNTACWPWEYTYRNGSCLSTCNRPYVISYQNHSYFCNLQCPAGMYAYDNGKCSSTCDDRFIATETNGYKYCKFPCYSSQYLFPNGSCSYICQSKFELLNDTFLICIPNNQTSCGTYEYNGQIRTNCSNPSTICGSGLFQYEDNTCADSCMYPYTPLIANSSAYCILNTSSLSCPSGEFMYYNGSCQSSCPPPLQANWNVTSGSRFCNSPCSYGAYVYENGTCLWSCPSPYVSSGEAPYLFCNVPCPAGEYLYPSDGNCTTSCRPGTEPYVLLGINYCIDSPDCVYTVGDDGNYYTNCTNPDTLCRAGEFLTSDNNCSTACDPPAVPYISHFSAYCLTNQTNTTEPYCEIYSTLYNETNNCTNLNNNCGQNQFEHADGHCDYYCYHPQYYGYIFNFSAYCDYNRTTTSPNNQTNTTEPYCEIENFGDYDRTNCTNPSSNCPGEEFEYPDGQCDYNCYHPQYYSYIFNFSAYCLVNSTYTNSTNPNNQTNTTDPYCEIYSSMNNSTTNCTNPSNSCGQNQFLYTDGHCDYYCSQPSYSPYIFNFSAYCAVNNTNTTNPNNQTNNTGTVSLQLYIRYNMSLIDFSSQNGLNIFIQQLALILGVDPSDIIIIDIREGSTIIESEVILTSESDEDSMNTGSSRAQEMSNRYSSAIGNQ